MFERRISPSERSVIISKMAENGDATSPNHQEVLIIGSSSIARHIFGEVDGVCPEVPLPTISVKGQILCPEKVCGIGALLKHWGLSPTVAFPAGPGEISSLEQEVLAERDIAHLVLKAANPQSTKYVLRVFSEGHQHAHIEMREEIPPSSDLDVLDANEQLTRAAERAHLVCVLDQEDAALSEKFLEDLFMRAKCSGAKIFYEPRSRRLCSNSLIDIVKINGTEAKQQFGLAQESEPEALEAADRTLDKTQAQSVVLTRGKHGILVSQKSKGPLRSIFVEPRASKLFDLVAAGDIVTAGLAFGFAMGHSLVEAACFAIAAAEIGISRFHDKQMDLQEIFKNRDSSQPSILRRPLDDPSGRSRPTKRTASYSAA